MGKGNTELLVPAGSVDSFRAAIRGGADAVYLGLKQFNARVRANNFSEDQLPAIMREARNHGVKVYITLNTVIKNKEIPRLLDFLAYLEKVSVDAIIVQDWGVFSLTRQYFPKLILHASTQMANHNSVGVEHAKRCGFQRVVMARELTMPELEEVAPKSPCELEVFIHGALCYSFSGQCFFSSYVGGRGANRGMCSQPCRMAYADNQEQKYLFNLKDNQQLDNLERLKQAGIHSLKIEGRMKSADYVFQVASAYRLALDHPDQTGIAAEMLHMDFGRAKTGYFLSQNISDAIAENANTGILLGNVIRASKSEITFFSTQILQRDDRLRIRFVKNDQTINLKIEDFWEENGRYSIPYNGKERISTGDEVYWIGRRQESFPSRLPKVPAPQVRMGLQQKSTIVKKQKIKVLPKQSENLFLRIDDPAWFQFVRTEEVDCLILAFSRHQFEEVNFDLEFIQRSKAKIALELPKFIAEGQIDRWKQIIRQAESYGINHFFVSHISQTLLLSSGSHFSCNEQVYVYNDAASNFLHKQHALHFCYSIENDLDNLRSLQNKQGIVLLHAVPELFYSRMPVKIDGNHNQFKDSFNKSYTKTIQDGITIVVPDRPVNLFQFKNELLRLGFSAFMIDLKHQTPNPKLIKKLFINYKSGELIQPATSFNFKKGLQ